MWKHKLPGTGESGAGNDSAFVLPRAKIRYNLRVKECPLCGEIMRLSVRERRDTIPGLGQLAAHVTREWFCPECDYFEEAESEED